VVIVKQQFLLRAVLAALHSESGCVNGELPATLFLFFLFFLLFAAAVCDAAITRIRVLLRIDDRGESFE